MDMNVNIYLPDDLGKRVKKAKNLAVSPVCQRALERALDDLEAIAKAPDAGPMARIEVEEVSERRHHPSITKGFVGRWLVNDFNSASEDEGKYSVALTKKGQLAVYREEGDREKHLHVYLGLGDLAQSVFDADGPQDLVEIVAAGLGVNRVVELDI